eukprot:COSAG05_NODE_153_length_15894_cov_27.910415_14_plen_115_part_00
MAPRHQRAERPLPCTALLLAPSQPKWEQLPSAAARSVARLASCRCQRRSPTAMSRTTRLIPATHPLAQQIRSGATPSRKAKMTAAQTLAQQIQSRRKKRRLRKNRRLWRLRRQS